MKIKDSNVYKNSWRYKNAQQHPSKNESLI